MFLTITVTANSFVTRRTRKLPYNGAYQDYLCIAMDIVYTKETAICIDNATLKAFQYGEEIGQ